MRVSLILTFICTAAALPIDGENAKTSVAKGLADRPSGLSWTCAMTFTLSATNLSADVYRSGLFGAFHIGSDGVSWHPVNKDGKYDPSQAVSPPPGWNGNSKPGQIVNVPQGWNQNPSAVNANPGWGRPPNNVNGNGPPPSASWGSPPAANYGPPPSTSWGPPPAANYGPPAAANYGPPPAANYGPPPAASWGQPTAANNGKQGKQGGWW